MLRCAAQRVVRTRRLGPMRFLHGPLSFSGRSPHCSRGRCGQANGRQAEVLFLTASRRHVKRAPSVAGEKRAACRAASASESGGRPAAIRRQPIRLFAPSDRTFLPKQRAFSSARSCADRQAASLSRGSLPRRDHAFSRLFLHNLRKAPNGRDTSAPRRPHRTTGLRRESRRIEVDSLSRGSFVRQKIAGI